MHPSRYLFIPASRRPVSLAPIYLAILCLFSVSALGFAVASWPEDPGLSPHPQERAETLPTSRPLGDVRPFPMDVPAVRHEGKWT